MEFDEYKDFWERQTCTEQHKISQSNITTSDRSFGCPIIYMDTIHNVILFINTSAVFGNWATIFGDNY